MINAENGSKRTEDFNNAEACRELTSSSRKHNYFYERAWL